MKTQGIPIVKVLLTLILVVSSLCLCTENVKCGVNATSSIYTTVAKQDVTFAVYIGGDPELTISNYTDLLAKIDGIGFDAKNISELTFASLEDTDALLLLGQKDFSEQDLDVIAQYVMFGGGSILYLVPTDITTGVEDFLKLFGVEVLGKVYDNVSYYENENIIVLNGTWENKSKIFLNVKSLVIENASALNITTEIGILTKFNLSETMNLTDNKTVPIVYITKLMWGGNNTAVEYKPKKYIYGVNITLGVELKFWSGSRILILPSPHILADKYVRLPQYGNEIFMEQILLWLGKQLESIEINVLGYSPQSGVLYLDTGRYISAEFEVIQRDVPQFNEANNLRVSNISLLAGLEYLGKLTHILEPTIVNISYDNYTNSMRYIVNVSIDIKKIYNRSVVVYLRVVAFDAQYGFFWSEALRFEIIKPRVVLMEFHPVIMITMAMLAISIISAIILYPHARKYKLSVKEFEEKIAKK